MSSNPAPSNARPLALGTLSFAVCFAAWGLVSAFAPRFREMFALTATQTALLVAIPVLLGSLARLPVGMLADRFGGRSVFTILMLLVAVPAWLVPMAGSYRMLVAVAFFLGIAGSSFPVGVGFVSRWTAPERQGSALGVYGLGNIGPIGGGVPGPSARGAGRLAAGVPRHGGAAGGLGSGLRPAGAKRAGGGPTQGNRRHAARAHPRAARLGALRFSTSSPSAASSPSRSTCRRSSRTSSA